MPNVSEIMSTDVQVVEPQDSLRRAAELMQELDVGALPVCDDDGRLEGIVLKDRTSTYRDSTRAGWSKVKDRSWYEREAWRFDRR